MFFLKKTRRVFPPCCLILLAMPVLRAKGEEPHLWTVQAVNAGGEFVCDAFASGTNGRPPYEFRFRRSKSGLTLIISYDGTKVKSDKSPPLFLMEVQPHLPQSLRTLASVMHSLFPSDPKSVDFSFFNKTAPFQVAFGSTMFNLATLESDHVERNFADCLRATHLE